MTSAFEQYICPQTAFDRPVLKPRDFSIPAFISAGTTQWLRRHQHEQAPADSDATQHTVSSAEAESPGGAELLCKRYRIRSILGEGSTSQVVLAYDHFRGRKEVAIKIMKPEHSAIGQREACVLRWLAVKAPMAHMPSLHDFFMHEGQVCLVLDRLHHSLLDVIVKATDWCSLNLMQNVRCITLHLLSTIADMHENGLVHLALTPVNILMDRPLMQDTESFPANSLKIIDFGTVVFNGRADGGFDANAQTLPYSAPEVIKKEACGPPADIWSLGCIISELLLQQPLFSAETPADLLRQIQDNIQISATPPVPEPIKDPVYGKHCPRNAAFKPVQMLCPHWVEGTSEIFSDLAHIHPTAADFVSSMLVEDPALRQTAKQLLAHPFLEPVLPLRHLAASRTNPKPPTVSEFKITPTSSERRERTPSLRSPRHERPSRWKQKFLEQETDAQPPAEVVPPDGLQQPSASQPVPVAEPEADAKTHLEEAQAPGEVNTAVPKPQDEGQREPDWEAGADVPSEPVDKANGFTTQSQSPDEGFKPSFLANAHQPQPTSVSPTSPPNGLLPQFLNQAGNHEELERQAPLDEATQAVPDTAEKDPEKAQPNESLSLGAANGTNLEQAFQSTETPGDVAEPAYVRLETTPENDKSVPDGQTKGETSCKGTLAEKGQQKEPPPEQNVDAPGGDPEGQAELDINSLTGVASEPGPVPSSFGSESASLKQNEISQGLLKSHSKMVKGKTVVETDTDTETEADREAAKTLSDLAKSSPPRSWRKVDFGESLSNQTGGMREDLNADEMIQVSGRLSKRSGAKPQSSARQTPKQMAHASKLTATKTLGKKKATSARKPASSIRKPAQSSKQAMSTARQTVSEARRPNSEARLSSGNAKHPKSSLQQPVTSRQTSRLRQSSGAAPSVSNQASGSNGRAKTREASRTASRLKTSLSLAKETKIKPSGRQDPESNSLTETSSESAEDDCKSPESGLQTDAPAAQPSLPAAIAATSPKSRNPLLQSRRLSPSKQPEKPSPVGKQEAEPEAGTDAVANAAQDDMGYLRQILIPSRDGNSKRSLQALQRDPPAKTSDAIPSLGRTLRSSTLQGNQDSSARDTAVTEAPGTSLAKGKTKTPKRSSAKGSQKSKNTSHKSQSLPYGVEIESGDEPPARLKKKKKTPRSQAAQHQETVNQVAEGGSPKHPEADPSQPSEPEEPLNKAQADQLAHGDQEVNASPSQNPPLEEDGAVENLVHDPAASQMNGMSGVANSGTPEPSAEDVAGNPLSHIDHKASDVENRPDEQRSMDGEEPVSENLAGQDLTAARQSDGLAGGMQEDNDLAVRETATNDPEGRVAEAQAPEQAAAQKAKRKTPIAKPKTKNPKGRKKPVVKTPQPAIAETLAEAVAEPKGKTLNSRSKRKPAVNEPRQNTNKKRKIERIHEEPLEEEHASAKSSGDTHTPGAGRRKSSRANAGSMTEWWKGSSAKR